MPVSRSRPGRVRRARRGAPRPRRQPESRPGRGRCPRCPRRQNSWSMAEAKSSFWSRVATRTRDLLSESLRGTSPITPGFYEELEEAMIAADFGPALAARITEGVRARRPASREQARARVEAELLLHMSSRPRWLNLGARPSCVLLYGINGAGKTTTAGKLAHGLRHDGRRVLLVAADTYRAAGIEQAEAWAKRAGVESFAGPPGGDPAAVVFDALEMARARGFDVVMVDTAGRLQTQQNLLR